MDFGFHQMMYFKIKPSTLNIILDQDRVVENIICIYCPFVSKQKVIINSLFLKMFSKLKWTHFLNIYGGNEQYSSSKSIKQYQIEAEQTQTSKSSEMRSGTMEERIW